jgi:hypothetical protein
LQLKEFLLEKYDVVVRQLDKLDSADEKEPLKVAKVRGYLLCLQDTLDLLRQQPAPIRAQSQPRQPKTLIGGVLGQRARLVAEDVLGAMESEGGSQ